MSISSYHNGDLLFVQASQQPLSQMIAQSTQNQTTVNVNYTHVAILEKSHDNFFVMHATHNKGCIRQKLTDFLHDQDTNVDVYRLCQKKLNYNTIINRAKALLGSPYNTSFDPDEPGYYCSSFIYEIFKPEHFFNLIPMQFGPRNTVLPDWKRYYALLHLPIPNGKLGNNPNSLLQDQRFKLISQIRI
ncbi:MAG: YiiX/YebB-like N1pC/P60 family cysteine hydrolase [Leuconostoc fallax]